MEKVLYTAELVQEDGMYKLVVQDVVRDTVQVAPVAKSAVDRLPTFLSVLNSKLGAAALGGRW